MFQLKGHSILLRQTTPEDAPVLFQAYRDKTFLRLFAAHRKVPTSEAELRRSLQKRSKISPATLRYIEWLIVHKRHGAIGIAALNDYSQKHGRAEYLIGLFNNKHCHLGYGIEATLLALDFAFNQLKLNKIQSFVYDYNPLARQILLKGDFKPEGIQENHHYAAQEQKWVSLYHFGLSVDDFRQSQVLGRLFRKRLKISPNPVSKEGNYQEAERISNAQFSTKKSTTWPTTQPSPDQALPPFSCSHTPDFPDILAQLGCTLVLSTSDKVILLSARADGLIQLPRTFNKPKALAVEGHRLAVATQKEVIVLANAAGLAATYPKQPNTYDSLLIPQATYYSGELDIHEMAWGSEGLWAVNTRFSCLSLIDDKYSFTPRWLPPFIKALTPDDCCHLNGFALQAGKPRYVTALGNSDSAEGWRPNKLNGGLLIDVQSGETLVSGLAMPHSPRLYDDVLLYLLNSAHGELLQVDLKSGQTQIINQLPGFARGMARCGDYLFIGLSKLRRQHNTIADLPIADKPLFCGVVVLHLPSGQIAGSVRYLTTCEEIYDVQILPNQRRPGIIGVDNPMHRHALATPTDCFWNYDMN